MMFYLIRLFTARLFSGCQRHSNSLRLAIFLLAASVINACGFQLRGAMDISPDITPIFIQQNSAFELAREIKDLLVNNHLEIAKSQEAASSQITLTKEAKSRRVLSVDTDGRAREYLLNYTVNFTMKVNQSKQRDDSLSLERSLLFDTDAVVAVANESEILYKDMQKDVARLILLKLQAHSLNHEKNKAGIEDEVPAESDVEKQ